jgi:LmbE family N-acetylglucosaminyl deacetylase
MFRNKRILVLAPHTDDGELGCGGTIVRALEEGAEVYYAALSTAEESVPETFPKDQLKREVKLATAALGIPEDHLIIYNYTVRKLNYVRQEILEDLVKLNKEINPDLVFLPVEHDMHQDHSTVAKEGLRAFKHCTILAYELIWNNIRFQSSAFVRLEEKHVRQKIQALAQYKTQEGKAYMKADFIRGLARVRGTQTGVEFAEAFELIRWII